MILSDTDIEKIISEKAVIAESYIIQPASIDLRLGEDAYEVSSFLPSSTRTIEDRISNSRRFSLENGHTLVRGKTYLIPLYEKLNLPSNIRAVASPKSTTGRSDIFVRLVSNYGEFDHLPFGYKGSLWLEVTSQSFHVRVYKMMSLTQLRFHKGDEEVKYQDIHIDLQRGYHAVQNVEEILDFRHESLPNKFFSPIQNSRILSLKPNMFYVLRSKEVVDIPTNQAATVVRIDTNRGEFRTNYAGFFDPGFSGIAVLEMRAYGVEFEIEDGQHVATLVYHALTSESSLPYGRTRGSSYSGIKQERMLGKNFKSCKY